MGVWDGIDGTNSFVPTFDIPGRNINISTGTVIIKGQLWWCDATVPTAIPPASAKDRRDRLVLRYDRGASAAASVVWPTVIQGVSDGSLTLPPLQQTTTGYWDIPVCNWISHASGAFDTLVDGRQLSGHSVVSMLSTARPSPTHPRLGLEYDTGYLQRWDGTTWRNIGPKNQVVGSAVTSTDTSYSNLHSPFTIPANDQKLGWVSYRLRAGGSGVQASNTPRPFGFLVYAFGKNWGEIQDTGGVAAGGHFSWHYSCELLVYPDGSANFIGDFVASHAVYNPGSQTSSQALSGSLKAGGVNPATATTMSLQSAWTSSSGNPEIVCFGATFDRVEN
jgi:hypothetical protein